VTYRSPDSKYQITGWIKNVDRQIGELAQMLTEVKHRRPLIHRIDPLEDERRDLDLRLLDHEKVDRPKLLSMSRTELDDFADEWRTNLEGGTMDKRKAVFRQLIESATFDGEELMLVPNMATLTGTGLRWRPQGDSNPCCRRERAVS
jgi:site-specific DNA recombinase